MLSQSVYTLINQQNGNLAFKLFEFDNNSYFDHIQRNNYFTLILITSGEGVAKVDFCDYSFNENTLFAFEDDRLYVQACSIGDKIPQAKSDVPLSALATELRDDKTQYTDIERPEGYFVINKDGSLNT